MPTPKEYIDDIKNRQVNSDKEYILDSLTGAIDRLQKAFPRYGSFLMEFVQNADDEESQSLKIEILENTVRIFNDGLPFSEKNVKSICKVGRSSKTAKEYIGYLGVGFKAVFLISERPEIYSAGYQFKFHKKAWDDPEHTPWQVIPIWIDNPNVQPSEGYKTIFNIPLKDSKLWEKIREEVKPEHLSDRILLFLRNLTKIEIIGPTQNFKRRILKSEISKTSEYEIYMIQEFENGDLKNQDYWLVFRSSCKVREEVKDDYVTKEWERDDVDEREILVAYKLGEENKLMVEEKGTAHIGVFSFLPLKEIPSGLNFLIQADFLTVPGRGELARECLWNEWLADEMYNLIISKCIPTFLKNGKWKMNFTEILYSSEGGHELFESHIKRPLREYLESNAVLIAEDGSTIKPDEAVSISSEVKELVSENDSEILYPGKKVLHSECSAPWEIEKHVEKEPRFNANSGFYGKMEELLDIKAKEKNIEFFKNFYRKYLLPYKNSSSSTLSKLRSHNVLLTMNWGLTNANSLYIKPKDLTIPQEIKENFEIVHQDSITEPDILKFLKILGVSELTKEHIQSILKTGEIPKISKDWGTLSNQEKIEKIKLCKELWKKSQIDVRDLGFLTLKTKTGNWLSPEEIVFSNEYVPEHNIEIFVEKGLYDLPIEFVSAEFIGDVDDEIREWYRFFKELGVDKKLEQQKEKDNIVQRIAILTALQFEKRKGRIARELPRSEEIGGYDIESEYGKRLIEVKGRSDPSPQIWLTPTQHKKLQKEGEKYFLYVVRDALKNPVLSKIKGSKLLDVDYSISIDFYKWKNLSEEEFQP